MRILVTGSRDWANPFVIGAALEEAISNLYNEAGKEGRAVSEPVIVHGDARGADRWAKLWALAFGYEHDPHPADWSRLGKAAGVKRNQQMVDKGADLVLAFPSGQSIGTRDCMERAAAAGIPIVIYEGEEDDVS